MRFWLKVGPVFMRKWAYEKMTDRRYLGSRLLPYRQRHDLTEADLASMLCITDDKLWPLCLVGVPVVVRITDFERYGLNIEALASIFAEDDQLCR